MAANRAVSAQLKTPQLQTRGCGFLTGQRAMFSLPDPAVSLSTPLKRGGGLFITKRSPVEILPLLNLNVSIINSQSRRNPQGETLSR